MPHPEETSGRLVRPERWLGGHIAALVCSGNADQAATNVAAIINFDANNVGPFGRISRSGNDILIGTNGLYIFSMQPQVIQNVANNITTIWARKNGVDVPSSSFRYSSTGTNDTAPLNWTVTANLIIGDVIRFVVQTSAVAGATLDFTAAGATPAVPAVRLAVMGYGPVA